MNTLLDVTDRKDLSLATDNSWILQRIDAVMQDALDKHDVNIALNAGKEFIAVAKIAGLGMAKLLYGIYSHWDDFGMEKDSFDEVVYAEIGLEKGTVERYIRVWAMYAEDVIPEKYRQDVLQFNIREQIPIANALKQGYEFKDEHWQSIVDAPDGNTIARIVQQEVRGKPPRDSALIITMDSDGELYVAKANKKAYVGNLEVNNDNPIVQQAIERIVKNTGILR